MSPECSQLPRPSVWLAARPSLLAATTTSTAPELCPHIVISRPARITYPRSGGAARGVAARGVAARGAAARGRLGFVPSGAPVALS